MYISPNIGNLISMGENLAQKLLDSARQEKKNDSQKESVGLNIMGCFFIFKDLDLP